MQFNTHHNPPASKMIIKLNQCRPPGGKLIKKLNMITFTKVGYITVLAALRLHSF